MPVIYCEEVKDARLQAVIDAIGAGTMEITDGFNVIATIPLHVPAFDTPHNGSMTLAATPVIGQSYQRGHAETARIKDVLGKVIVSGLIIGRDVLLSNPEIMANQEVRVVSGTIIHG